MNLKGGWTQEWQCLCRNLQRAWKKGYKPYEWRFQTGLKTALTQAGAGHHRLSPLEDGGIHLLTWAMSQQVRKLLVTWILDVVEVLLRIFWLSDCYVLLLINMCTMLQPRETCNKSRMTVELQRGERRIQVSRYCSLQFCKGNRSDLDTEDWPCELMLGCIAGDIDNALAAVTCPSLLSKGC